MLTLDDAIAFTLDLLRQTRRSSRAGSHYGYDVYNPTVAREWAASKTKDPQEWDKAADAVSGVFLDAMWELCRRGVLRPGVRDHNGQMVGDALGYSLTSHGRTWLTEADESHFILLQPGSLAAAFDRFGERFGPGYRQRTQEAVRCRAVEAWLAACAMVGAAAESILLALAIAKTGDEERVMSAYTARDGRRSILNQVTGKAPGHITRPLTSGMQLLSYWRDSAGHGQVAPISSAEADQSLRELLSLSQTTFRDWDELTARGAP